MKPLQKRRFAILLGWVAWIVFVFSDLLGEMMTEGYARLSLTLGLEVNEMNFWVFAIPMIIWYFLCGIFFPIPQDQTVKDLMKKKSQSDER